MNGAFTDVRDDCIRAATLSPAMPMTWLRVTLTSGKVGYAAGFAAFDQSADDDCISATAR
jgi:hypothetical protein